MFVWTMLMKCDFVMNSENLDINHSARIDAGVQQTKRTDEHLKCNMVTKKGGETLVYVCKEGSYHEFRNCRSLWQDFFRLRFKYLV